jgi:cellulose synthase/poly-beta-1,6-N-acetylglucosamine synthase-like glycosyltransferase
MVKKIIIYLALYLITGLIIASVFILQPIDRGNYAFIHFVVLFFMTLLILKYTKSIFLIIIAPWNRVVTIFREKYHPVKYYKPRVSVIIPAYNEEVGLLNTVKTVLKSDYKNMEVIVVNDGSTDQSHQNTINFMKNFDKKELQGVSLKYYYKENGGKGKALNYGIMKARGDIVITIDADCIITPTTVSNFVKPFADPKVNAVVGNVKIGNTSTVVGTVQFLEFLNSFYAKNAESVLGTIYIIGGAAAALRRSTFSTIGLYNHKNITEDIDISVRICDAGLKVVYAEDAVVYTEGASDVAGLAKQRLRWKIGWFQTLYVHRHILFSRNTQHNKILTWLMIPFVYFSNIQLIFEPWFIIFLYFYSYWLVNFEPFLTWIGAEAIMIFVVMLIDKKSHKLTTFFLVPITWLLFYLSTYIEYRSLVLTAWYSLKKREVKWQKWQRTGCEVGMK